jgi:predicted molibdopterin-dependent oxidoreductase YjgC
MLKLTVDGDKIEAREGAVALDVLRKMGKRIPTICHHPSLKPSGSCKLCAIEVHGKATQKPRIMLACVLKVKDGMEIRTTGEMVERARTKAFRNLLQLAPQSDAILALAKSFDIDPGLPPDGCIRCRLCIRVCKEIVGPGALKMEKRDNQNFVVPIEGLCIGCGTCANICPTKVIKISDRTEVRTLSIRDEVIGTHPLERCEGCGKYYATPKFLNHIHHRTEVHPDVKTHHHFCPTCTKLFSDRIRSVKDHAQK